MTQPAKPESAPPVHSRANIRHVAVCRDDHGIEHGIDLRQFTE